MQQLIMHLLLNSESSTNTQIKIRNATFKIKQNDDEKLGTQQV